MWTRRGSRRVLLDILGGNGEPSQTSPKEVQGFPQDELQKDELLLIWELKPNADSELPALVILPNGESNDFLAWISTFAPGFLPFTAFVRVLETSVAKTFLKPIHPALSETESCCAGLILGEVFSEVSDRIDTNSLTPIGCASTLSYCMSRALALELLDDNADRIMDKWCFARQLLGQPDRKLRAEAIRDIWLILADILKGDRFILKNTQAAAAPGVVVRACLELKKGQRIEAHTWRELVANSKDLLFIPEKMQGPREERVARFETSVSSLTHGVAVNWGAASFLCGHLASLIEPGSLSHFRMISPLLARFPTAMLWYGLCAGLQKKSQLLNQFNALGRRVTRDIGKPEPFLSRPQSDIAIDELEVLLRGDKPRRDFHRSSPKQISIEISPRIHTILNWAERSTPDQDLAESSRYSGNEFLAKQLAQAIQSLNQIQNRLAISGRSQTDLNERNKTAPPTVISKDRAKRRR
jgi:hypothetical protein